MSSQIRTGLGHGNTTHQNEKSHEVWQVTARRAPSEPTGPSHYVGIGASAGGREAIESFSKRTAADSGPAHIAVQHLSPDHKRLFDGMPKSAINTGLPDFILPSEEMPGQLLSFIKHPYTKENRAG